MTANEAKEFGLIDKVLVSRDEIEASVALGEHGGDGS
jgi:ATP-dependent protease ClpP protease subunit